MREEPPPPTAWIWFLNNSWLWEEVGGSPVALFILELLSPHQAFFFCSGAWWWAHCWKYLFHVVWQKPNQELFFSSLKLPKASTYKGTGGRGGSSHHKVMSHCWRCSLCTGNVEAFTDVRRLKDMKFESNYEGCFWGITDAKQITDIRTILFVLKFLNSIYLFGGALCDTNLEVRGQLVRSWSSLSTMWF